MAEEPKTNVENAVRFLEWKRPGGPWPITLIVPETGRTPTTWLSDADAVRTFVKQHSGRAGIYYTVAEVTPGTKKKPSKPDLVKTSCLHVDLDPPKDIAPDAIDDWVEEELARVLVQTHSPPPSAIVRSGNGLHLLLALDEPLFLGGAPERVADVEERTRALCADFGADGSTWNADRLLRLPGTINLPNAKKRKDGRTARDSSIVDLYPERVYTLADFRAVPVESNGKAPRPKSGATALTERVEVSRLNNPDELDQWNVPPWARAVIVEGTDPTDPDRWGGDRSAAQWAVTCELARRGVPPGLIVGTLTDKTWGIAAHVLDQKRPLDYAWKQVGKAYAEAEAGELDPSGRRVLDPADPFATAKRLHGELFPHAIHTNDDWLAYDRGAYRTAEDATMRGAVWKALDAATVRKVKEGAVEFAPFKPGPGQVSGVLDALEAVAHQPADRMAPPVWLDGDGPPPLEMIALRNGLLHVPSGELLPPTPRFFTRNALDLDFMADAPPPAEWLRFVAEVFPDPAAAELLQDWFGYLLLPDTSQQKIMLLVGPTRSGKGVIQHVITALVGAGNVCAPSPNSLGSSNVGALQPLIGTTVAFLSDARFGGRSDKVAITANLLAISAGDPMTIDRKHKAAWTGRLATRLVIMSNELPSLRDNSPALANRFTPLILERSFLGREDVGLAGRIIANELPGVLLWALEGWRRMRERGHFALPAASEEAIAEILDLGSPVAAFVNARCELGEGKSVETDALYRAYKAWCEATEQHAVAPNVFGRDLGTATGGKVKRVKTRVGARDGGRVPVYLGVELHGELGPEGWHPGPEPGPAGLPFGDGARWEREPY